MARLIFIILLYIMVSSCSTQIRNSSPNHKPVVFPSPPDTARIQYLTSISSSSDIEEKQSVLANYVLGEKLSRVIEKPYGIAIKKGKLYICDTMLPGLEIIDLEKNSFEYFIPEGAGQLKKPINCFVDSNGNLYIADAERNEVIIFDNQKNFIGVIGQKDLIKPTDVVVYQDKIWVCDIKKHQISVFNKSRSLLFSFPDTAKNNPDYLFAPTNLIIKDDIVFITDTGDAKVKKYTLDGEFIGSIGQRGKNHGQFVRPKGLAVDEKQNLFVVDAAFENVQIFNKDAQYLMFFGGTYKKPGNMWLPAGITIDYQNLDYFRQYVHPAFELQYLVYVTNQYGPDKVSVYGFINPKRK